MRDATLEQSSNPRFPEWMRKPVVIIEFMIADEVIPKPRGQYKKHSVEDTSGNERVFECDALIVELTVRKIGKVSFTKVPVEGFSELRCYLRDHKFKIVAVTTC